MPNTLAHLGIQTICSKTVMPGADFKWIALGCIVPDLPWIVQRIVGVFFPWIDPLDLRLYCIAQASLFFSFLVVAAVSLQFRDSGRLFLLLAGNCLLHLLLDATQIKWANGVHLLAPVSWESLQLGLYWPESPATILLTLVGLGTLGVCFVKDAHKPVVFLLKRTRVMVGLALLLCYLVLPLVFFQGIRQANNHFIGTLSQSDNRDGKSISFDRAQFLADKGLVVLFTGEMIRLSGMLPDHDAVVSLNGTFSGRDSVRVSSIHVHSSLRDFSSIFGLAIIGLCWLYSLRKQRPLVIKNYRWTVFRKKPDKI